MTHLNKISVAVFALLILLPAQSGFAVAQEVTGGTVRSRVRLRNLGMAKVLVSKGSLRRSIDLSEEVAGCSYVSGSRTSMLKKRDCAAPPASFTVIDTTTENGNSYLVVLSTAMDNCNVCGECGATEAYSLIWLELDSRLRMRNKKSVTVEDCRDSISLLSPGYPVDDDSARSESTLKLPFKGDTLVIEFEKMLFSENRETKSYQFSRLEYSRKHPALGLVVTSETRAKSSSENP